MVQNGNEDKRFTAAIPVLASLNIDESIDFYVKELGFGEISRYDDYGVVNRDNIQIHFWYAADDRHIAENTSCRVEVTDLDSLFEEYESQEVTIAARPREEFGLRQFAVHDLFGNLIWFFDPLD